MGNKRRNRNREENSDIEPIGSVFNEKIDNLNLSFVTAGLSSTVSEPRGENFELEKNLRSKGMPLKDKETIHEPRGDNFDFKENLRAKEISLKDKEIELLRRENELIRLKIQQQSPMQNIGFTFRDVEESMTKFSGDDCLKIEKWITDFEDMAATIGWNELQKLVYSKRLLIGTAKQSISCRSGLKTWEELKEYLKYEFKVTVNSAQVHRMLSDRKKKSDETFYSYLLSMKEIAEMSNFEDEALFDYIISGIGDTEQNKSVLYGAESMDQFKKKLKIYEDMKKKFPKRSEFNTPKLEIRKNKGIRCYTCGDRGHLGRNCANKGPKCYKCNNFGHIAPNCPQLAKDETRKVLTVTEKVKSNIKQLVINGVEQYAMVDSGSDVNLMTRRKHKMLGSPPLDDVIKKLRCAGSQYLVTDGCFTADVNIDNDRYSSCFHVVADDLLPINIIIGHDLMRQAITILTPNEVIIRKILPDNFMLAIHQDDELPVDTSHIKSKSIIDRVRKLVLNYSPTKPTIGPVAVKLKILLSDDKPVYQRPRRLAPLETSIAKKQIEEWLQEGIIRHSISEYASPIVLANKRDGTIRLCVDYRKLNDKIIKDRYPLPLIEEQIDQLQEARMYTKLDLKEGFFHVPVEEASIKYTAFVTHFGHYEFLRTPFGLCNSPSVFQRYINIVFQRLISEKKVCVYMDDLIIPSKDEAEGLERLEEVLDVAENHNLKIKWSKCEFLRCKIEYLGYEIESGFIRPSNTKIACIKNFKEPTTEKCLQRFLGLTGYFRKFVKEYALLAKPLSDMLRKNEQFEFGSLQRNCFTKLKDILTSKPVLKIYSVHAETELHCDACKQGIASILLQMDDVDRKFHPVFFYSRKTTPAEEKYSSYELEALAIVKSLKKFRVYLLGLKFKIITDCMAFNSTIKKKDLSSRIAGWVLQLQEYNFKMEHRSSNLMRHVDALSRAPQIMVLEDDIIHKIKLLQHKDDSLKPIFELLRIGTYDNFICTNDILYKVENGSRLLVVPKTMHVAVIQKCHDQGHFGVEKTEELIKREFFVKDVSKKIKMYIQNCVSCILAERKRGKLDGNLYPIPKGDRPLSTFHIDHMGHLENTRKSYKYILSVIDGFSKFVWLYPCKTLSSSEAIQKLKYQQAIFGNPNQIIADRAPTFTSEEFKQYCDLENIQLHLITTGMQRGNGQVERLNQIVIPALIKLTGDKPAEWFKYTDKVQRYLNNSYHRSIGMSPFENMFGVKMRSPEDLHISEAIDEAALAAFNEQRCEVRERAKQNILKMQSDYSSQFNKKRKPSVKYKLNDLVAIKRTQFSGGGKLQRRFLGPYTITKVREFDRYDVKKVGEGEGPRITSTGAEFMKPYQVYDSEDNTDEEESLQDAVELCQDEEAFESNAIAGRPCGNIEMSVNIKK